MRQFIITLSLVLLTLLWCAPAMAQEGQTYGSDLTVSVSQELIDADRESPAEVNPPTGGGLHGRQAGLPAAGPRGPGALGRRGPFRERSRQGRQNPPRRAQRPLAYWPPRPFTGKEAEKSDEPIQGGKNKAQKE